MGPVGEMGLPGLNGLKVISEAQNSCIAFIFEVAKN